MKTIFDHEHRCYFTWCTSPIVECYRVSVTGGKFIKYSVCSDHRAVQPNTELIGTPDECLVKDLMDS